ncbi:hypothetical protein V6N13_044668 [Hibiscus sabdariffa]
MEKLFDTGQQVAATELEGFTSPSLRVVSQGAHHDGSTDQGPTASPIGSAIVSTARQQAADAPMVQPEGVSPTFDVPQGAQSNSTGTQIVVPQISQPVTSAAVNRVSSGTPVDNSSQSDSRELRTGVVDSQRNDARSSNMIESYDLEPNDCVRSEAQQSDNLVGNRCDEVGNSSSGVELTSRNSHAMTQSTKH